MLTSAGSDDDVLRESQAVLAAALDAYIAIDSTDRVVGWNPAAESTFGYSYAQARGRDLADLIVPEPSRQAHRDGLARLVAGGTGRVLGQRLTLVAVHADGHEFPIELTLTATRTAAGQRFHAFCHDVTAAQRVSRFADVEAAISHGLALAASSGAAATRVTQALGEKMGWPVVELWLADDQRDVLRCTARHVGDGLHLGDFAFEVIEAGMGLPGRVYEQSRPDWIADLAADTRSPRSRAAARIGLHVAVGVPICSGGLTLGALCVYGAHVEDPEDSLTALLTGIAAQLGQYLERRRAEELTVELARTKDEFLALVTHELQNPLAVITASASMFADELDTLAVEDQRHYLRIIARSAERLSVLTSDLLDLARLESGHLDLQPATTELCTVIGHAVDALAATAAEKDLTVVVDVPARLELQADAGRLQQVADNLLSNAIKYTPDGGTVTIAATLDHDGGAAPWIVWTVADTGIGIPAAERPRLFRRFYRASTAVDRRIPGTGLGLVITRTIVERHGGSITVAEQPGPGTTFRVRLPAIQTDG